jgi:hypothetical protein
MKKTSKKSAKAVEIKQGEVCVPCRFPDATQLLKTGLKAGLVEVADGDPGTCPPGRSKLLRV